MLPLGLGVAVAASDTGWIAVGGGRDFDIGVDAGAVALWHRKVDGVLLAQIVEHPKQRRECAFGASVALDALGSVLVIGAPSEDGPGEWPDDFQMGRAYVYERAGEWRLAATLETPRACVGGHFGAVVAADGTRIVVGSPDHNGSGFASGRADVFVKRGDAWAVDGELLPPSDGAAPLSGRRFATSLAIAGDMIVVGSPHASGVGYASGRVDIFRRTNDLGWHHVARVDSPSPQSSAMFGMSVAICSERDHGERDHGDGAVREVVAIGAPRESPSNSQAFPDRAGVVHLFACRDGGTAREEWTHTTALTSPQPWCGSEQFRPEAFGMSLAARSGLLAVGASESCNPEVIDDGHENGEGSGSAYVFDRVSHAEWRVAQRLVAPHARAEVHDGYRVALGFSPGSAHGASQGKPFIIVGRLGNADQSPGPGEANLYALRTAPLTTAPTLTAPTLTAPTRTGVDSASR